MAHQCVVAVYESLPKAKEALKTIVDSDFPDEQLSFVTRQHSEELQNEEAIEYGDKSKRTATKGAGVGSVVGILLSAPIIAVTGVGAVLIGGPLAAGMGLAGAVVGGFLGAMTGWGVDADHVRRYEKKVADGAILIIAHGDPEEAGFAKQLLRDTDAEEVKLHAETSADSVSP